MKEICCFINAAILGAVFFTLLGMGLQAITGNLFLSCVVIGIMLGGLVVAVALVRINNDY
jgi:hypothetical protein